MEEQVVSPVLRVVFMASLFLTFVMVFDGLITRSQTSAQTTAVKTTDSRIEQKLDEVIAAIASIKADMAQNSEHDRERAAVRRRLMAIEADLPELSDTESLLPAAGLSEKLKIDTLEAVLRDGRAVAVTRDFFRRIIYVLSDPVSEAQRSEAPSILEKPSGSRREPRVKPEDEYIDHSALDF